jgi:hypothetical protein
MKLEKILSLYKRKKQYIRNKYLSAKWLSSWRESNESYRLIISNRIISISNENNRNNRGGVCHLLISGGWQLA